MNTNTNNPQIETCEGILEGFCEDGVNKFFGIPFAQPPLGSLRWRHPLPPAPWKGVREVKRFSAAPYQAIGVPAMVGATEFSEDCLYLNVWAPADTERDAKLPVMVWFFGGGNLRGAASMAYNDGTELAKMGMLVVTPNYRVASLGFLNDETMGANFAIGDDVAALRWVRDNIAQFGGDPERVLIAGHSAGAIAVRSLLDCPAAKGLFQRAFVQSAGFENPANDAGWNAERSRKATEQLFEALGTQDPDELRRIPVERISATAHPLSGIFPKPNHVHTPLNLVWMPVPDGRILGSEGEGWADGVPVMVGCTQNEARWSLNPAERYSNEVLEAMTVQLTGNRASEVQAVLNESGGTEFEKLDRLYTTAVWTEPAYQMLKRFSAQGKKLFYVEFARSGPQAVSTNRLACHESTVPYIFGNLAGEGAYDDIDRSISLEMRSALIEFAKTGVPKSTSAAEWPSFDPASPHRTLIGDTISPSEFNVTPLLQAMNNLRNVA
jgi:para-nitrobenzyl esterase